MRTLVALVVVAACGSAPPSSPTAPMRAPAVEPTRGICAHDRTAGAATAKALLAGSDEARRRGCYREAVEDALAASAAPDLGTDGPLARLALLEAGQELRSMPVVGPGEASIFGDLPDEEWAHPAYDLATIDGTLDSIATEVERGAIPAAERERGRIARLLLRYTPSLSCQHALNPQSPEELRKRSKEARGLLFSRYQSAAITQDEIAGTAVLALGAKWVCDLTDAASAYDRLASLEDGAGDPAAATDARLAAWESRYIPGGYAGELGMNRGPTDDVLAQIARDLEAASTGAGAAYQAGTAAARALDAIARGPLDSGATARVAWYRSILALRLLGQPSEAKKLAARAQELAVAARRADLLDGARLVSTLATAELGEADELERSLAELFASTKLRGALGARDGLVLRFQVEIKELGARGRSAEQLVLARALRRTAIDLTFMATFALHNLYGDTLAKVGRLDEALEERTALLAELAKHPDRAGGRDAMLAYLRNQTLLLRAEVDGTGAMDAVVASASDADRPIFRAFLAGDLRPMSAFIRTPQVPTAYLSLIDFVCAARPRELIAAANEAQLLLRSTKEAQLESADQSAEYVASHFEVLRATNFIARSLMNCGATIHDLAVFQAGRAIARELGFKEPYEEALAAEAANNPEIAAATWERLNRQELSDLGHANLYKSSYAGTLLEQAARSYLDARPPRVEDALLILEQSRSRDLRVARILQRPRESDPALAPVLVIERKLAAAQSHASSLASLGEVPELARARANADAELARLVAVRDAAVRGLGKADPKAYRAAALAPALPLRDVQARLLNDEVLVYYLVDIVDACAIVVDKHRATAVHLPARDAEQLPALSAALWGYRLHVRAAVADRGLRYVSRPAVDQAAIATLRAELYDRLVRPLESAIPPGVRVLVIPDKETADIAFAELGPADHPWIERNPIRLLPGTYLLDTARHEVLDASSPAVVVGDPDYTGVALESGLVWPALPSTRKEATDIAHRLGATPLLGRAADESTVKKALPGARVIHLATHGQAFVARPATSRLVLAAGAGEDGYLHAYEIEHLRLGAQLVVLSACETGTGQAAGSEGLLALDRAFLAAGAGAVVSSLWVVPDEPTAALMSKFYEELAAKRSADVALQNAMQYVRTQPAWTDPLNWAAFRLVGAGLR